MKRFIAVILLAAPLAACSSAPVYQTYATAFGNYDRVFDATVQVLDKYSFLREVDRETGMVVGEMKPDRRFFDPTRRELVARVLRRENFSDVQVRVVYSIEEGQPFGREGYAPGYQWRRLDFDRDLEQRLTVEVKELLSGSAWASKQEPSAAVPAAAKSGHGEAEDEDDGIPAEDRQVAEVLATRNVTLSFQDAPLEMTFDFLREISGLNIVLARSAREAIHNLDPRVTLEVKDIKLGQAIELMQAACSSSFEVTILHGSLLVTAPETLPGDE